MGLYEAFGQVVECGIGISGDYAYVTSGFRGVIVLDISDPQNPRRIGRSGWGFKDAYDIAVRDTLAYVGLRDRRSTYLKACLAVLDVSDPANPRQPVGWLTYLGQGIVHSVSIKDTCAFLAAPVGLAIVDISDPSHLTQIGSCPLPQPGMGVDISGSYAYVVIKSTENSLYIVDISDRSNPVKVGSCSMQGVAHKVAVSGGYALVTTLDGVNAINIADPDSPFVVDFLQLPDEGWDIAISGGNAYVADFTGGIQIIDISDPQNLTLVGSYADLPHRHTITGVCVQGNDVYTAGYGSEHQAYLWLMNELMADSTFTRYVDDIPCEKRVFWMQQCHSGGFVDNLTGPNTVIMTACDYDQLAAPADDIDTTSSSVTENEWYQGEKYYHGEFDFHAMNALRGRTPPDAGEGIDADLNGDGATSMYEAGQWELANNSQSLGGEPGDPQYSDLGGIGACLFLPYVLEVSGRIETNTAWCGYVTVLGDVTVADTVKLTIYPGTTVKFASGSELGIEGSLVAEGTAYSKITFTSASQTPKPGDWHGIRVLNGGSADIRYATIEYGDCGVSFDSAQAGNVISCAIKDHSVYGIRGCATTNLYICGNTISMPVLECDEPRGGDSTHTSGIYIEDASTQIVDNQIGGGYYGIYGVGLDSTTVIKGSSNLEQVLDKNVVGLALYSGSRPIVSDNKINEYRDIGVVCYESCPLLGDSFIPGTGHNSIIPGHCSPQYAVYCEGVTDTIKAEMIWWGQSPPDPSWFSGPVDYDPWLDEEVGVEESKEVPLPEHFSLSQNYPNPFNPTTQIKYALPRDCWVRLEIYNILGQRVATLVDGKQKTGNKVARWDASRLASGVYFYRIRVGDFVQTRRMILLK